MRYNLDAVKRLVYYKDGKIFNRVKRKWCRLGVGDEIGFIDKSSGYVMVTIMNASIRVHRLVWEIHNGPIPDGMEVDHINHIRHDNRIENLRVVTKQVNGRNQSKKANNKSGHTGVSFVKSRGSWNARITGNGKRINLGNFKSKADAIAARLEAEKQYKYHDNHGV